MTTSDAGKFRPSYSSDTSMPIRNQVISRYCPSFMTCYNLSHVKLRYAPKEPHMINLDTSQKQITRRVGSEKGMS